MKSKHRPSVSDENLVSEFRSDTAVTYMPNFKIYYQKKERKNISFIFLHRLYAAITFLDRLD